MNKNNSNSKNRELAYNGIGSGGGGGGGSSFEVKSFTYTGTGSNVIEFPVKPNVVLSMSTVSSGFHIRHIPFVFRDGVTAGLMIFDQSSAVGTYTIEGQTVTINGFSDAQGGLYREGEEVTVYYI